MKGGSRVSPPMGGGLQPGSNLNRGLRFLFLPGFDVLGRVAGILALIISLIHPAMEAWHDFRRRAATEATNVGSPLELAYDPIRSSLEFRFPVILRNEGTRDDILEEAEVSLVTGDEGDGKPWGGDDITVASGEEDLVTLPYPVRIGSHRLRFVVRSILSPEDLKLIRAEGERRLVLHLKAETGVPYTLRYCFYLTQDVISGLLDSDSLQRKTFLRASCS